MSVLPTSNIVWFTTLRVDEKPFLRLTKKYNSEEYPKYINYDAINIDKTKDIPIDYDGEMGVPVSFITRYNPDQFKIIGKSDTVIDLTKVSTKIKGNNTMFKDRFYIHSKYRDVSKTEPVTIDDIGYVRLYDRIVIKWRTV